MLLPDDEEKTARVHAMPLVRWRQLPALIAEEMTKMAVASVAKKLHSRAVGIVALAHGIR